MKALRNIILICSFSCIAACLAVICPDHTDDIPEPVSQERQEAPQYSHKNEELHSIHQPAFSEGENAQDNGGVRLLTANPQRISPYGNAGPSGHSPKTCTGSILPTHRTANHYKQFAAAAPFCCQPACEYYVFALRRLLI